MKNIFFISDTHFSHGNICKFIREDGVTKLRPWDNVDEMDEYLVEQWNATVGPQDKVYHLGDVFINRKARFIMDRLNGDKVLIKGNHDIFQLNDYLPYFRDIRSYLVRKEFIASHIPVHYDNLHRFKFNVHGHLHEHRVVDKWGKIDPRYLSVCVEHTEYRPRELSEITEALDKHR
jgi:calcineurin-like phosphoesterase family protein